jgi:hypothetical protein
VRLALLMLIRSRPVRFTWLASVSFRELRFAVQKVDHHYRLWIVYDRINIYTSDTVAGKLATWRRVLYCSLSSKCVRERPFWTVSIAERVNASGGLVLVDYKARLQAFGFGLPKHIPLRALRKTLNQLISEKLLK